MKCIIICSRGLILEKHNHQNQESEKKKFRGIKTTSERLYETKPKTIINRFCLFSTTFDIWFYSLDIKINVVIFLEFLHH